MIDQATLLLASADPRLSSICLTVLWAANDAVSAPLAERLDRLCDLMDVDTECVFAAVARLEGFGYLPKGVIR